MSAERLFEKIEWNKNLPQLVILEKFMSVMSFYIRYFAPQCLKDLQEIAKKWTILGCPEIGYM